MQITLETKRERGESQISDEKDVLVTSSRIRLFQMFVSKVYLHLKKCPHDVVGILITSESSLEYCM